MGCGIANWIGTVVLFHEKGDEVTEQMDFTELFRQIAEGKIIMITSQNGASIVCSPDNLKFFAKLIGGDISDIKKHMEA